MKVIVPAMAMAAIVAAPKAITCSEMRFGIRKHADMLSHTLSINLSTWIFVLSCSELPAVDVCQRERQTDGAELGEVIQSVADDRPPVLAAAEDGDLALFLRNEYVFFQ